MCLLLPAFLLWAQEFELVRDFEEMDDSKPAGEEGWIRCRRSCNSGWGTTDIRYERSAVPELQAGDRLWKGQVWKGERSGSICRHCSGLSVTVKV